MNKITHFNFPNIDLTPWNRGYKIYIHDAPIHPDNYKPIIGEITAAFNEPDLDNLDDPYYAEYSFRSHDFHLGSDKELTQSLYDLIDRKKKENTARVLGTLKR